jgi:hypothetical protein
MLERQDSSGWVVEASTTDEQEEEEEEEEHPTAVEEGRRIGIGTV